MQNLIKVIFALLFIVISYKTYAAETVLNCDGLIFKREKPFFTGKTKYYERVEGAWLNYCSKDGLKGTFTKDSAKCSGNHVRSSSNDKNSDIYSIFEDINNYEVIDFFTNQYILKKTKDGKVYEDKKINCSKM